MTSANNEPARIDDALYLEVFSNFSPHEIEVNGSVYPTVEHAYHAARYEDPEIVAYIREAQTPLEAWERSQEKKEYQREGFQNIKREVMKQLCMYKLLQHPDVKEALCETGEAQIVKHVETGPKPDGFWDDGVDGMGQNECGKIWMELRAEYCGS